MGPPSRPVQTPEPVQRPRVGMNSLTHFGQRWVGARVRPHSPTFVSWVRFVGIGHRAAPAQPSPRAMWGCCTGGTGPEGSETPASCHLRPDGGGPAPQASKSAPGAAEQDPAREPPRRGGARLGPTTARGRGVRPQHGLTARPANHPGGPSSSTPGRKGDPAPAALPATPRSAIPPSCPVSSEPDPPPRWYVPGARHVAEGAVRRAQEVPLAASARLGAASAAGTMLGRSRLGAGFLAVAAAVAVAQHAPPVGELEGRRCGRGGEGGHTWSPLHLDRRRRFPARGAQRVQVEGAPLLAAHLSEGSWAPQNGGCDLHPHFQGVPSCPPVPGARILNR